MRYIIEIFFTNNCVDIMHYRTYQEVTDLIKLVKLLPGYKECRVYKLIGQYKNENI